MSMDINKLPSNSNASKAKPQAPANPTQAQQEKPASRKVVKGKATVKKNEVRKFTDIFVAEDARSVWGHLVHEMVIPMTKNLLVDFGQAFIERMITGGSRNTGRGGNYGGGTYRDYSGYSRDNRTYAAPSANTTRFDYEDIVFPTAGDANAVLDQMDFEIRKYGLVRVSDYYDISGLTAPHTAHHYGWTNLGRARVVPVRGGFIIELPKAATID